MKNNKGSDEIIKGKTSFRLATQMFLLAKGPLSANCYRLFDELQLFALCLIFNFVLQPFGVCEVHFYKLSAGLPSSSPISVVIQMASYGNSLIMMMIMINLIFSCEILAFMTFFVPLSSCLPSNFMCSIEIYVPSAELATSEPKQCHWIIAKFVSEKKQYLTFLSLIWNFFSMALKMSTFYFL